LEKEVEEELERQRAIAEAEAAELERICKEKNIPLCSSRLF